MSHAIRSLLKKARESGCVLMALGVETFSARNLEDVNKTFHAVDKYAEGFNRIMDAGISPHALIIFGLPDDNAETFKRTVNYLESLKVPITQFFILTPYPGRRQATRSGDRECVRSGSESSARAVCCLQAATTFAGGVA